MLIRFLAPVVCALAVTACGSEEQASAANRTADVAQSQAPTAGAPPTADDAAAIDGARVYNKTCFVCHGSGAGGAPTLGAREDWEPRIAQGQDVLYQHAIAGFTGDKGVMPAKGANLALSDDEVKAAVDYMQSQVP
jgi:cytochrome c5